MMISFGMTNLRRLKNVPAIEIRPITLLVGRNSSGKSSYLRSLPLIRQSLMTRTSAPILWYGDLVDFGSFENTTSNKSRSSTITFRFGLEDLEVRNTPSIYSSTQAGYTDTYERVSIEISIVPIQDKTRLSEINISIRGDKQNNFRLTIDEADRVSSFKIDGREVIDDVKPYSIVIRSSSLFPDILVLNTRAPEKSPDRFAAPYESIRFYESLKSVLKPHIDQRLKSDKLDSLIFQLISIGYPDRDTVREYGKNKPKMLSAFLDDLVGNDSHKIYQRVENLMMLSSCLSLFRSFAQRIRNTLLSTLYIGPARARSERYYRYQDLSVSDIDPDGKNFPVFLNSLTARQMHNFSAWVRSLFGYNVSVTRERDHISISLKNDSVQSNIVDVGYGVSQILPVLGQMWWARNRPRRRELNTDNTIVAIEQPELHLHPAHQSLLADALVGILRNNTEVNNHPQQIQYLIETHSETLVNRLGELISEGKLGKNEVQIIIFEPNKEDQSATDARVVHFSEDGALINWPYGFFQPAS